MAAILIVPSSWAGRQLGIVNLEMAFNIHACWLNLDDDDGWRRRIIGPVQSGLPSSGHRPTDRQPIWVIKQ